MKKVPCTNEDKLKSYYKYYAQDVYIGEQEKYDRIPDESLDPELALKIQDRNKLFDGNLKCEFGWWQFEDGTAMTMNPTFLPGVTGEMFDWWFAWHPIDRLRYACWDNEDHYDVYLEDPERARDLSLSMRERHWGSVHHIWEDIGLPAGSGLLVLSFKRPEEFDYDINRIDTPACNGLVCANVKVVGDDQTPDVPVVMTHFLKPVEGGSQLESLFWFGWQIVDGVPVKSIPDGVSIPKEVPVCMLNHNVKEFSNLAKILPKIYAEEKDNWF